MAETLESLAQLGAAVRRRRKALGYTQDGKEHSMAETLESLAQLGAAVRRRRKALGYTQEEVAEFNQVSPRFVGDLERGVAGGTFARVLDVCNSIGLDLLVQERGELR